jgi:hypothetical protein
VQLPPNKAFESGRADKRGAHALVLQWRAAQRERYVP